jgi:hypothetical protein
MSIHRTFGIAVFLTISFPLLVAALLMKAWIPLALMSAAAFGLVMIMAYNSNPMPASSCKILGNHIRIYYTILTQEAPPEKIDGYFIISPKIDMVAGQTKYGGVYTRFITGYVGIVINGNSMPICIKLKNVEDAVLRFLEDNAKRIGDPKPLLAGNTVLNTLYPVMWFVFIIATLWLHQYAV